MNVLMAAETVQKISNWSLAGMGVSLVLLIGFPIFAMLLFKLRLNSDVREMLFGAIAYIFITILFVNVVYILVMMIPGITTNKTLYALMNALVSIIPEVFGLAVVVRLRKKENQNLAVFAEFGTGYVTVELVMVAATVMMTNLSIAYSYNTGGLEGLTELTGTDVSADFSYLWDMISSPSYVYLLAGIEGVFFSVIRICFIVLMYMIGKKILPNYWYAVICGLYFVVRMPSALSDMGVISASIVDPALVLICLIEIIVLFRIIKKGIPQEIAPLFRKKTEKGGFSFRKKNAVPQSHDQGFDK